MKEIGSQYRDDAMRKEEFRVGEWKGSNLDFEGFDFVGLFLYAWGKKSEAMSETKYETK